MLQVDIEIHKMPPDCPAYKNGSVYGCSVTGNTFGYCGPAKDKIDIISSIKRYIKSEEEYHSKQIRIKGFENSSDLDITIADLRGEQKLTGWIG